MSLSKFDRTEVNDELAVLQDCKEDLEKDFENGARNLLLLLKELESHLLVSRKDTELFCLLDEAVSIGPKVRYLVQLIYNNVKKNPALFNNLLIALSKVKKWSMYRKLINNINKLRGIEERWLLKKDLPVLADFFGGEERVKKWNEIGIMLKLPLEFLDSVDKTCDTNWNKLVHVLCEWLTGNYEEVTVTELHLALSSNSVGQKELADDIKEFFIKDSYAPLTKKPRIAQNFHVLSKSCSMDVVDGKSVLLEVQIISSEPATFTWMKDDQVLKDDELYSGIKNDILIVHRASEATKGTYRCFIKHSPCEGMEEVQEWVSDDIVLSIVYTQPKLDLITKYSNRPEVQKDNWALPTASKFIDLVLIEFHTQYSDTSKNYVPGSLEKLLQDRMKKKLSYEDLFGEYRSQARVLVEGRPGSGKTTLACKITRDWARGKALRYADFVYLLPFRSYKENEKIRREFLALTENAESCQGQGYCFILDGLDEWRLDQNSNELIEFMRADYLPHAMIIVMSRPAAAKQYRDIATQRVETEGFFTQQVYEYIEAYPFKEIYDIDQENESISSMLIKYVKEHTNVLHMCYLPVHAAMICFLYNKSKDKMPETETQVYEYFTCSIILRIMQKSDSWAQLHSLDKLEHENKKHFLDICKIAFKMTCESKQVVQDPNDFSLNSKYPFNSLLTIDTVAQIYGVDKDITFLHLTLQEYLAARHVADQPLDEQREVIEKYGRKDHMQNMWKFYCGVLASRKGKLSLFEQLMKKLRSNHLHKIGCAYEYRVPEACTKLVEIERGIFNFHSLTLKAVDFTAIGFVLKEAPSNISELDFRVCTVQILDEAGHSDRLQSITDLASSSQLSSRGGIQAIAGAFPDLLNCYMKAPDKQRNELRQTFGKIYDTVKDQPFSILGIDTNLVSQMLVPLLKDSNNILMADYSLPLIDALNLCAPHLCSLNFSQNVLGFKGVTKLSQILKDCCSLQKLDVSMNVMGSNGAVQLAEGLERCVKLRVLKVHTNEINGKGEKAIAAAIRELPKLTDINISWNNIGYIAFVGQPNLIKLDISGTNIGPSLTRQSLRFPPTIEKLNLSNNKIDSDGARALAESFKSCEKIRKLLLSNNKIGFEAALAIIDSVSSSVTEVDLSHNSIGNEYWQLSSRYPKVHIDLSHQESMTQPEHQDVT